MKEFETCQYKVFDYFKKGLTLVTAGNVKDFSTCTIGWGTMGTLWSGAGINSVITVFVHPSRYTCGYLKGNERFTVSFFSEQYRDALRYLGTHSGRDGDKITPSGLTPMPFGESVAFEQAETVFLCRKVYQGTFRKEGLAEDVCRYYAQSPLSFPPKNGVWQPHCVFVGQICDVINKTSRQGA